MTVEPGSGGKRETLLDETVDVRADDEWRDRELDLDRWSGSDVTLTLATEATPGQVAAWSAPEVVTATKPKPQGWDVILVSLDTLRADHLGVYGYERPTSPNLDALARESIVFQRRDLAGAVDAPVAPRALHRPLSRRGGGAADADARRDALAPRLPHDGAHRRRPDRLPLRRLRARLRVVPRQPLDRAPGVGTAALAGGRSRKELLFLHTYKVHDPYEEHQFAGGLPRGRLGPSFSKGDWMRFRRQPRRRRAALRQGALRRRHRGADRRWAR